MEDFPNILAVLDELLGLILYLAIVLAAFISFLVLFLSIGLFEAQLRRPESKAPAVLSVIGAWLAYKVGFFIHAFSTSFLWGNRFPTLSGAVGSFTDLFTRLGANPLIGALITIITFITALYELISLTKSLWRFIKKRWFNSKEVPKRVKEQE